MAAGLGLPFETIGLGQVALRDFVAAEPVSHNINDPAQAEIWQPGEDFRGRRVALTGYVLEAAFPLLDAGADLGPDRGRGDGNRNRFTVPGLAGDVDSEHRE